MTLYGVFEDDLLISDVFYTHADAAIVKKANDDPDHKVKEVCSIHQSHATGGCERHIMTRDADFLVTVLEKLKESV